ncbi:hypothetical protein PWT90_00017 [Aphanocladium album]|nr:hypothetical protein PWT90_00017 [Aphanocladium album]
MSSVSNSKPPMKTREIPSYASNNILRTSRVLVQNTSGARPAELSRGALGVEGSQHLAVDRSNATARTSPRSMRDAGGHTSQSREHRAEKRNAKNPPPACLTKALSEIAQDTPSIGVADVASFAKRSIESRQMEAAKVGKVKRPLNAFMLYRKAYQDVAKTQCSRNNHQQVSTICGSSWNGWEPPGVIAHFKQLASIEKQLHEKAFPAYKYDPVQAKKSKDGIEQDTNTCHASDGEPGCRPRRSGRQRATRGASRMKTSFTLEVPDQHHGLPLLQSQQLGSAWPSYQNLPLQDWYTHTGIPTTGNQYATHGATQRADDPGVGISYGRTASDLHFHPYASLVDPYLDPSLHSGVSGSQYGQFLGTNDTLSDWLNIGNVPNAQASLMPDLDITGAHTAYLRGSDSDWQVEQLEDGSHFSDWMMQADGSGQ